MAINKRYNRQTDFQLIQIVRERKQEMTTIQAIFFSKFHYSATFIDDNLSAWAIA